MASSTKVTAQPIVSSTVASDEEAVSQLWDDLTTCVTAEAKQHLELLRGVTASMVRMSDLGEELDEHFIKFSQDLNLLWIHYGEPESDAKFQLTAALIKQQIKRHVEVAIAAANGMTPGEFRQMGQKDRQELVWHLHRIADIVD